MTFKICTAVVSANTPHFGALFPLLALRSGFSLSLPLWNGSEVLVFLGSTYSLPFSWQYYGAITSDPAALILIPCLDEPQHGTFLDVPMLIANSGDVYQ